MEIDKGKDVIQFLIDRIALNYPYEAIKAEWEGATGMPFKHDEAEVNKFCDDEKDPIQKRRDEFEEFFRSQLPFASLMQLQAELTDLKKSLAEKDYKNYISTVNSLISTLDLLSKILARFQEKKSVTNVLNIKQNNYIALKTLEEDKVITINEPKMLKK